MLAPVSLELARRGVVVSVVARGSDRLAALARRAGRLHGRIHGLAVDYRNSDALRDALSGARHTRGNFDMAVSWIHAVAPEAPDVVAASLQHDAGTSRYFNVRGSTHASPGKGASERRERLSRYRGVLYREVVLGFVSEGKASRWLTDAEIAGGVLEAIDLDAEHFVVGTVHPWHRRPSA
jgi:hypothetical protein